MKKGSLLEILETVLVVTVITALIWLYAEAETTRTDTRLINVRFVTPARDMVASILDENGGDTGTAIMEVGAVVQATRGDWARVEDWIDDNTVEVRVGAPQNDAEDQVYDIREELNRSDLAQVNAFIKETEQTSVTVRVQRLRQVEMAVVVEHGDLPIPDESPPIPDPSKVNVWMPVPLAGQVQEQNLKLTARLDEHVEDPESLEEDTPISEFVPLELPAILQNLPHVGPERDTVDVRFIIRKETEEHTVPRVQVRLLMSPELARDYNVQIDEDSRFLRVKLNGPTQAIRRITENTELVRAYVLIKLADVTGEGPRAAPLEFDLPDGVRVLSTEPSTTTISFTAKPRNEQP